MKIATFSTIFSACVVANCDSTPDDWVQTSESIEIEFIPLPQSQIVPEKVNRIDAQIEQLRADFSRNIESLQQTKSELLALTHQPRGMK